MVLNTVLHFRNEAAYPIPPPLYYSLYKIYVNLYNLNAHHLNCEVEHEILFKEEYLGILTGPAKDFLCTEAVYDLLWPTMTTKQWSRLGDPFLGGYFI